jgi:hypothetical protein
MGALVIEFHGQSVAINLIWYGRFYHGQIFF